MTSQVRALPISCMTGIQRLRSACPKLWDGRTHLDSMLSLMTALFPMFMTFALGIAPSLRLSPIEVVWECGVE